MKAYLQSRFARASFTAFVGLPLLLWALGDFPERSLWKESLSVLTILALFQLASLFFWSRANAAAARELKMRRTITTHKAIGYTCAAVMLLHPLFLVMPRFFEAGVAPGDAFVQIITTLNPGLVLGLIAWFLLLILCLTAFLRGHLPMAYKNWRRLHGILAAAFIIAAVGHAVDLGRHSSLAISSLIIVLNAAGVRLFLKKAIPGKTALRKPA